MFLLQLNKLWLWQKQLMWFRKNSQHTKRRHVAFIGGRRRVGSSISRLFRPPPGPKTLFCWGERGVILVALFSKYNILLCGSITNWISDTFPVTSGPALGSEASWVMAVPDYARGYLGRQHEPLQPVTRSWCISDSGWTRIPAVVLDDVIRWSNVCSLHVWGEPEVRRGQNQNTWRWFCHQFQNKAQTCTTNPLSSCVADYEKTSEWGVAGVEEGKNGDADTRPRLFWVKADTISLRWLEWTLKIW